MTTIRGTKTPEALSPAQIEAMVDASAAAIGIALTPESRPGVLLNFARTAELAHSVLAFALGDDVEPAPVFRHDRT